MIDITDVLNQLASQRPIFHSEADFQHALAWQIQGHLSDAAIRLEFPTTHLEKQRYLDIRIIFNNSNLLAIELKYKTRALAMQFEGEQFTLKNQSAQDIGRYDFLKDVQRLEQFLSNHKNGIGYAVFLTNDSAYWKPARNYRTVDQDFRLHDGRSVEGAMSWKGASAGTMKNREEMISLKGKYQLRWEDYSKPSDQSYGRFRYLAVKVT